MIQRLILTSILALAVSGCVPAIFIAGGAAAGGSLAKDSRNLQTISDDTDTEFRANNLLQTDKTLAGKVHASATVYNGILLLTGEAPTAILQQRAEAVVQPLKKVRRIYNQIIIADPIGSFTRSNDALITANVKSRMLATTNLKASAFKIVTEDGTVFIMGLASQKQADMAVEVARHSAGVKQVVKIIEYTH